MTATSIASGENAYVTNTGTATNQLLNIHCPRGADGSNGSKGDKGNTGNTGPQGETGGDGGGAVAGGIAGGIAGTASGSVAGGIAGSAVATSICSAQLAVIEPQISALTTTTASLQTQINTLGDGMLQIDNDIIQLKAKTSNISAVGTTTFISGTVETGNIVNSGTLYSAGDATIVGSVKASNFTGGLLPTKINGTSISIGTNEVLFNNVTIGSATTITTIHGIVNYSNPFNNFFSQF